MQTRKISLIVSVLVLIGLMAGCAAPAGTGTTGAAEPAATEAVAAEPAGPFEPMFMAAENGDYDGVVKHM